MYTFHTPADRRERKTISAENADWKEAAMDYSTIIYIILIVLFMLIMHRVGGMGCCGAGHRHGKKDSDKDSKTEDTHKGHCG